MSHPPTDVPLFLVDAFAQKPFEGNPAAVCLLDAWPTDAWLQSVAAEMNQAETAFVVANGQGFDLRWFTPSVEVDLCGHATLAAASVLWSQQRAKREQPIGFSTRSGLLLARQRESALIELDFPLEAEQPAEAPSVLLESLAVRPDYVGRSRFDYLIAVNTEAELRALDPDFRRLATVDCRGVIVTAPAAGGEFDFVSRFFAPASGIDEDSVTGSAHCTLADYWGRRLNRDLFRAFQASRRGGVVQVTRVGQRVLLAGTAVMVAVGQWVGR